MAVKKEKRAEKNRSTKGGDSSSSSSSFLIKTYLFSYNFIQVIGWSYLLMQIIGYLLNGNEAGLYETVKWTVIVFQNAAALEIVHASMRLVPSNTIITTFQVLSRVMVVCGVLMPTLGGRQSPGLALCLLAWAITEIIRYLYYALNIVHFVPNVLVWFRYTTFIVLYPIGVTGELLCFYGAQNEVAQTGMWSTSLPNSFNFSFNYRYFLIFVMLLYIPLFPQMYMHMFAQRKKILGGQQKLKV